MEVMRAFVRAGSMGRGWRGRLAVAALGLGAVAGCDDGTSPALSRVQIVLTDAPSDAIASAEVWVSRVYLQGGSEEEAGRVDLFNDSENPRHYDLLTLQDGVTAELTEPVAVEAGSYAQLRLVVDSAKVTLLAPYTFAAGGDEAVLKVPSGSSSGIKVQLDEPIVSEEGQVTIVVVDFDVEGNFVLQGVGQGTVVNGVIFTPSLKEKSRSQDDA